MAETVSERFGVEVSDAGTALPPSGPLDHKIAKEKLGIPSHETVLLYAGDILAGKGAYAAREVVGSVQTDAGCDKKKTLEGGL